MKEFIDKLNSRLEELKELHAELIKDGLEEDYHSGCEGMCVDIIEIVNQLAEEYINCSTDISTNKSDISTISKMENVGWIPCERELPEENDLDNGYVEPSDAVLVFTKYNSYKVSRYWGNRRNKRDYYDWVDIDYRENEVIAWMPLPVPFKEGE